MRRSTFPIHQFVAYEADREQCAPDWSYDSGPPEWSWDFGPPDIHNSSDLMLWTAVRGQGRLRGDGRSYEIRAGDCFVLRMWRRYYAEHDSDNPLEVCWASYVNPRRVRLNKMDERLLPPLHRKLHDLMFFEEVFNRAMESTHLRGFNDRISRLWFAALFEEVLRQDVLSAGSQNRRKWRATVLDICRRVRQDPSRTWRVEALAEETGCSIEHFSRTFKGIRGLSPQQFILYARIGAARHLLRTTDLSVTRIAERCGFGDDVFRFSRTFKARIGVPPTTYRRQERAESGRPVRAG